ncbi:MAG TPA: potassium transporter Kup [Microthrixaceae bacterium]|jgi:KUP system potassium uptake protein|nr:potassium transporter Kup [Microthrixaceae bacterium]HQF93339.1 potassium transporter Kup [Microthrixaceae bacterium]
MKALTLGALGVVFGDIGTSPLYALRESFHEHHGRQLVVDEANVLGLLSLVFWALVIIISIKYLLFVMRADNGGEGGILALTALVRPSGSLLGGSTRWLVLLGLFGASLLYGDGMITPAISVLSAVEGVKVVTTELDDYIIPIAIVILVALFAVQKRGTAAVGKVFGPIMVVWFLVLGVLGVSHIADDLSILRALSPHFAVAFMVHNGILGFLVLGSVFLVVTGGEALYADMGHFGRNPIKFAWYGLVLPALLLNYFGQGAMMLSNPGKRFENPFYEMAPRWALWPLVILATCATVIASQALISGAFSLTRQAVQLGYLPRVKITHTSESEEGQIYVPAINWLLLAACVGLVLGFKTSSNLAAAYGLAVTATMAITTILFYRVARTRFGWSTAKTLPLCTLFMVMDLGFLGANLPKIPDGGWVPLVIGGGFLIVLTTWFAGRKITAERIEHRNLQLLDFIENLGDTPILRGPGVGVYLGSNPDIVPQALSSHLRHASVLPAAVVVLAVKVENRPHVFGDERLTYDDLGNGVHRLVHHAGFSDDLDIPLLLATDGARLTGLDFSAATFVLGRETLRVTDRPGMAKWRERLFVTMLRNATTADVFFKLPPDRTIELGVQVEL